jgi:cobalt-zinc-cadmium efflux system protein
MTQQRRLMFVLVINVNMIVGLVLVGLFSHSISILAAGGDFVADSLALALGILAVHLRDRHGNMQAPTYVALVNGLLLLGVTVWALVESVQRLVHGNPEIHGLPVLMIAVVSTLAMFVGTFILGLGAGNEDLHMRSVLLDTISDGLSAAAVAVVGGIIYFTGGLYWLDSVTAIVVGVVIGFGAVRLLRDVARSLRSKLPLKLEDD